MTLFGILSSPSQRRTFLLTASSALIICATAILVVAFFAPDTRLWNSLNSLFISVVASGVFAVVAGFYILYFFVDPAEMAAQTTLLPDDIGEALQGIASQATEYRIYVRTGRHFRAEILPVLIKRAREARQPTLLEVILLDFRDADVCERYANFRKAWSFDRKLWDDSYVQKEVLATILALIHASRESRGFIKIHLFLSKRLSTFRIEGSSDAILVTREDPKDTAARYPRTHCDFGAFLTEFRWIREEAFGVVTEDLRSFPSTLGEMFGESAEVQKLEGEAQGAISAPSPYVR